MHKKFITVSLSLALASSFLLPAPSEASWGAAKLLDLRNQTPVEEPAPSPDPGQTEDPLNPTNPQEPPSSIPPQNNTDPSKGTVPTGSSIAKKILALRNQRLNQPPVTEPDLTSPVDPAPNPTPAPPTPTEPATGTDSRVLSNDSQVMVNLINAERTGNGLKPLQVLPTLTKTAADKSIDMLENNYFSHTSPTYGLFASMVYDRGIFFRSVGENLAQARNTMHAHKLLMASDGHRKNILNPNFTHVGVGIVQGPYGVIVTELFIMQ